MFKLNLSSFSDIKDDLEEYINNNKETYKILDSYEGSAKTLIVNLFAGFASFLSYKYTVLRSESYLYSAKMKSSIYLLARHFGYRINRNVAPTIRFKYIGNEPFAIQSGFVFAKYRYKGDVISVVYFGDAQLINYNDFIDGHIGIYNVISGDFTSYNFNETVVIPTTKKRQDSTVDNGHIRIFINNVQSEISDNLEDFILREKIIDHTAINDSSELWICDKNNKYGCQISKYDNYRIEYIESFGYIPTLNADIEDNLLEIEKPFVFSSIQGYGLNQDTLSKIKEIATLYYTSLRRMVTFSDHEIITRSYPSILDTNIYVYRTDRTSIIVYYILEGSAKNARIFTETEKNKYLEYLDHYKLLDLKIDAVAATPVVINLYCAVKYYCTHRNYEDYNNELEVYLQSQIDAIITAYQFKFNKILSINAVMMDIGRIKYNNNVIVKEVYFKHITDDGVVDLTEESVFNLQKNQYFYLDTKIELACV